jgi:hypothetical protein
LRAVERRRRPECSPERRQKPRSWRRRDPPNRVTLCTDRPPRCANRRDRRVAS